MKKQAIEEALALLTVAGYSFFDKPFKALKEEEKRLENEQRLEDEKVKSYRKQISKYRFLQGEIKH
jgi:hypothetical protein